ncbi:MAG: hypothetical protein QM520_03745 [Gammaproteobacteria bacterium]|nr:hypothetical protein [Gammaproteobacteria bacterium]
MSASPSARGFVSLEILVTLTLLSIIGSWSYNLLDYWLTKVSLLSAKNAWVSSINLARALSLGQGESSYIRRIEPCQYNHNKLNWNCGWQVIHQEKIKKVVRLPSYIKVDFSGGDFMQTTSTGDTLGGGASARFTPKNSLWQHLSFTACVNIASRIRYVQGIGCNAK